MKSLLKLTPRLLAGLALMPIAFAASPNDKENLIILDAQGVKNLHLEMAEASEADFEQSILALGRIAVFPGNLSVVSSRIPGRALTVNVKLDQKVNKGDPLLTVESRQPGDPPPSVILSAPISGLVANLNIAPGRPVSPEASLLEIVDLSQVHAIAKVPEHFAGRLKEGQKAHIRVPGYPDKTFAATLEHLGALADETTGTLEAAFHVPNPDTLLRPGMKAEFSIVTSSRSGVMAVPREAVQGEGAARFVYIADYDLKNAFLKTPVVIGEQNDAMVEIVSGLLPGDTVVTRGAYGLGFAGKGSVSLKEALDAAHGHPHGEDGSELSAEDQAKAKSKPQERAGPLMAGRSNTLTLFFAVLSSLLLVLLILSLVFRKRATA
ncbi:MAG TPA: efflux RND transporter periplasmic adaptor subunit [Prosthecobacter sp.]|nr:efflux RND transporter periplasmic adaptor subunit [Prosthecobacter sp.]